MKLETKKSPPTRAGEAVPTAVRTRCGRRFDEGVTASMGRMSAMSDRPGARTGLAVAGCGYQTYITATGDRKMNYQQTILGALVVLLATITLVLKMADKRPRLLLGGAHKAIGILSPITIIGGAFITGLGAGPIIGKEATNALMSYGPWVFLALTIANLTALAAQLVAAAHLADDRHANTKGAGNHPGQNRP